MIVEYLWPLFYLIAAQRWVSVQQKSSGNFALLMIAGHNSRHPWNPSASGLLETQGKSEVPKLEDLGSKSRRAECTTPPACRFSTLSAIPPPAKTNAADPPQERHNLAYATSEDQPDSSPSRKKQQTTPKKKPTQIPPLPRNPDTSPPSIRSPASTPTKLNSTSRTSSEENCPKNSLYSSA